MSNNHKMVKASEYYSKRVEKTEDNASLLSDESRHLLKKEKNDTTYHQSVKNQASGYHSGSAERKPPNVKAVTGNLKEAVKRGSDTDKDEVKMLSHRLLGIEAAALAEWNAAGVVKREAENIAKGTRYTVTRFSKENRDKRNEYNEYYRNKKEMKRINKRIREWKKQEENEIEPKIADKYKKKQEKAKQERDTLRNRNHSIRKAERKRKVAKRHSQSISVIKSRALSEATDAGKELIKTPNRFMLMLTNDLEAERLVQNSSLSLAGAATKAMLGMAKLFLASLKSILVALSPLLFLSILMIFMIYILFFTDFESAFDLGIEKEMISSEDSEDIKEMVSVYIMNRRNEMAAEQIGSISNIQVYFVKLDDDKIAEIIGYLEDKSKELGNPSLMFENWMQSAEADTILKELVNWMCYILPENEAAVYPEENLEAYSENPEPEATEPEQKENTQTGIGAGAIGGIGIGGIGTGSEGTTPEPETEQTITKVVIGYHPVNELN
ncbi:MAG: hypothetical protein IJA36_06075 [Lachnospiraceae bacterium]|nr:hypothetical protein [Lachnospiraceae bacterium]